MRIDSSGEAASPEVGMKELRLTSQTKPGPNMAAAVATKVLRRDSGEEKELVTFSIMRGDMAVGVGDRVEKNWWLFQAMLAWLKSEAMEGSRAVARRISWVGLSAYLVPRDLLSKGWGVDGK